MRLAPLGLALLLSGCAVGPDYHRPDLSPPASYRGNEQQTAAGSFAAAPWRTVYTDPKLQDLIVLALQGNLDLKTAMARIDEARAELSVTRMAFAPTIDATGSVARGRTSVDMLTPGSPHPFGSSRRSRSAPPTNSTSGAACDVAMSRRAPRCCPRNSLNAP